MKKLFPCLVVFLLTTGCGVPNPYLLGAPCAITTNTHPEICWKDVGFDPPNCAQGLTPDFAKAIHDWLPNPTGGSPILAMSMGTDVIHVYSVDLPNGTIVDDVALAIPNPPLKVAVAYLPTSSHGWMAIGFTMNSTEVDEADLVAGSDIHTAYTAGELDQTIFNYIIEGSDVFPEEYTVGQSQTILSASDLGMAEEQELRALNLNMAMYHADLDYEDFFDPPRPLPTNPTIYFTLEPANLQPSWYQTYVDGSNVDSAFQAPSSATILASTWDGSSWSTPKVYQTWHDLGLKSKEAVIDGLSIDIDDPGDEEILFSTRTAAWEDQMLYFQVGVDTEPRRFVIKTGVDPDIGVSKYGSGGKRIGSSRGLGDFCTEDPFAGHNVGDTYQLDDFFVARRHEPAASGALRLGVSGFRRKTKDSSNNDIVVMRSCMEYRNRPAAPLQAVAYWTVVTFDGVNLGPLNWGLGGKKTFENWTSKSLTVDAPIPRELWLPNPPKTPWTPSGKLGMAVQWVVWEGDTKIVGPLSVLRL